MELKEYIKQLVHELLDEESTTGSVPGYSTPFAFSKKGQKTNAATAQAERSGWKKAPGMPKNSKIYDYKELWKGKKSAMNENMSTAERLVKQAEKEGHIKGDYSQRVLDAAKKVAKEYDSLKNDEERKTLRDTYYNKFLKISGLKESLINIIKQELLNEVTYSKFKKDVKHRTKSEQLHKAIREVKRKLMEIDRIVEYTSRMKQELSEDEGGISYWKATQNNIGKISEMVNQLNNKIKNLHQ